MGRAFFSRVGSLACGQGAQESLLRTVSTRGDIRIPQALNPKP